MGTTYLLPATAYPAVQLLAQAERLCSRLESIRWAAVIYGSEDRKTQARRCARRAYDRYKRRHDIVAGLIAAATAE